LGLSGSGVLILELPFKDVALPSVNFFQHVAGAELVLSTAIDDASEEPLSTAIHLEMGQNIEAQSALMVAAIRHKTALGRFLSDKPVRETLTPVDCNSRQRTGADIGPIDRLNTGLRPDLVKIEMAAKPTLYWGRFQEEIALDALPNQPDQPQEATYV
jgi:hypothetical protein